MMNHLLGFKYSSIDSLLIKTFLMITEFRYPQKYTKAYKRVTPPYFDKYWPTTLMLTHEE